MRNWNTWKDNISTNFIFFYKIPFNVYVIFSRRRTILARKASFSAANSEEESSSEPANCFILYGAR